MRSVAGMRIVRGVLLPMLALAALTAVSCVDDDNPAAPAPATPDKVLRLDGDGDCLRVPIANHTFNRFTIEAWVKVADYDLNVQYVSLYQNAYLSLWDVGDEQISTWASGLTPVDAGDEGTEPTISANAWHHFAFSYDGTNQYVLIDGEVAITVATTGTLTHDADTYDSGLVIGARYSAVSQFVTGDIDEVRLWNVYRTPTQIKNNMSKVISDQSGLVGYWNFDDGTGNDLTAYDADGTLVGDATFVNQ